MKIIIRLSLLLILIYSYTAYAESFYVPFVKPIEQKVIDDPKGASSKKRFEGCGPVASAMILSYWEGEQGYRMMSEEDSFNGTSHPYKTIKELYIASKSKRALNRAYDAYGNKYYQTYTTPNGIIKGLRHVVKKANENNVDKLKVERMGVRNAKVKKMNKLKSLIKKKIPVITLLHNIPSCLNGSASRSGGWHYVVVVGYDDEKKTIDLLSGWQELDASSSTGNDVHYSRNDYLSNNAHIKCTMKEFKKAKPAFYWIEQAS